MKKNFLTFLVTAISIVAFAQWNNNPAENNRITPLATEIYAHDLKVTSNGTSFVVFNRPMGGSTATFIQIVDVNGYMMFPEEGKLISNKPTLSYTMAGELLFVDDDDNALIVVTDCRNAAGGDDISYTLYKVSPTGEMLWGENGVDICNGMAYGFIAAIQIVQLEDGSYVCAWMSESTTTYIQLMRVSKSGELLWNETNTRIFEVSTPNEYPYLVNAGNNQVIIVFSRGSMFSKVIKARKFDSNFANVWSQDMDVYTGGGFGWIPLWTVLRVIPDHNGGAFVGWNDDRYNTWVESTYVAHVKAGGTHGFASGVAGEKVGYSPLRSFYPEMYFDNNEGFLYVTWRETDDNQSWQQQKAQKIKVSTAELMWGNNGKDITPVTHKYQTMFYSIRSGGNGKVAIFFTDNLYDPVYFYGWDKQNITLLNSSGDFIWNEEIIQFSTPVGFKGSMVSTPLLFNNYWLTAWNDERKIAGDPGGSKKIYMQRINLDGTLGNNGAIVCLPPTNIVVDHITHNSAVVSWEGDADDYELEYRFEEGLTNVVNVIGAHSYTLEDLEASTLYYVKVRSICSEENVSDWSETKSFYTLVPCFTPVNLNVTDVTLSEAHLYWDEGNEENISWELRYSEANIISWIYINDLGEKQYFLEGLNQDTKYLWTARANCAEGQTSDWAPESDFTTDRVGITEMGKKVMTVYALDKVLNIINPKNTFIENVQIFDIAGKLLGNYRINSNDNLLIPTNFSVNEMILFVKIIGQNETENHKVLLK